jgi:hypothetical protein
LLASPQSVRAANFCEADMSTIPFKTSQHQVLLYLDSISRQAWVKAAEIYDIADSSGVGVDDLDTWHAQLEKHKLENKFWELYEALAYCPIDRDGFRDLALLSACTFPRWGRDEHEQLFPYFEVHGNNIGIYISSIRQDKRIPQQLGELVTFAKNSVHYTTGGSIPAMTLPPTADQTIGGFLYKQFFKTTSEVYSLDLADITKFVCHLCFPTMLMVNPDTESNYTDLEDALHHLRDFVRSY